MTDLTTLIRAKNNWNIRLTPAMIKELKGLKVTGAALDATLCAFIQDTLQEQVNNARNDVGEKASLQVWAKHLLDLFKKALEEIDWPKINPFPILQLNWGNLKQAKSQDANCIASTSFIKSCGVEKMDAGYVLLKPQGERGNDLGKMSKNTTPRIRIITITKVEGYSNPIITDCPNFTEPINGKGGGDIVTEGCSGKEVHGEKSGLFLLYNFLNEQKIDRSLKIETWVYKGDSAEPGIAKNICDACKSLFASAAINLGYTQTNWQSPYDMLRTAGSVDKVFKEWKNRPV